METPQHKLISVIGNVAPDGSANFYDVLMRVAKIVRAPHYPLITPVFAESAAEREAYMQLNAVKTTYQLAEHLDAIFVGVGQFDETAPMILDGFISKEKWQALRDQGATGEIGGRVFDSQGNYLETDLSDRITSIPLSGRDDLMVTGIASGSRKVDAIRAALIGNKINALVTDEPTARALIS